jgi:hypothetical protein
MDRVRRGKFAHTVPPALAILLCAGRLLWIIRTYSVNVFFGDQWLYDEPLLFHPQSAWTIFRWQSNPWRQGLGGLLSAWIGSATHWNSRVESFVAGGFIIAACFLALVLKVRISGKLTMWDSLIPLFLLTPVQYETEIGVTSLSHGPLPLLFVIFFSLAWTIKTLWLRYSVLIPLTFVATHTGFGMFIGFLCPLVIGFDWWTRRHEIPGSEKRISAIALTLAVLSLAFFFTGYQTADGVCGPHGLYPLLNYFLFTAFMLANFVGLKAPVILVPSVLGGSLLLVFVAGMLIFALQKRAIIPLFLISYSLLFAVGAAHGRMCLGLGAAVGSRYAIYLAPAFLGMYILVSDGVSIRDPLARPSLGVALATLALVSSFAVHDADRAGMSAIQRHKSEWRACYLAEHDLLGCNKKTGAAPYSYPATIQSKLDFLQAHRLNLFAP